jgi:hypothetical protein
MESNNFELIAFALKKTFRGFLKCIGSPYFWACAVYLLQCQMVVETNLNSVDIRERVSGNNHILLRVARVLISCMFILTWRLERNWMDSLLLPDYLDLFASFWMLLSAMMYNKVAESDSLEGELVIWRIEVSAWFLELIASFGWVYSWYVDYYEEFGRKPEPTPNRGWTLDDPDNLANITNILTAVTFFVYYFNLSSTSDTSSLHEFSDLRHTGESLLLFNAWVYLLVSMRNCDVFWFMPVWGALSSIETLYLLEQEEQAKQIIVDDNSTPELGMVRFSNSASSHDDSTDKEKAYDEEISDVAPLIPENVPSSRNSSKYTSHISL